MAGEFYKKLNLCVRRHRILRYLVLICNERLVIPVALVYLAGIFSELSNGDRKGTVLLIAVPAAAFLAITVLRKAIGRPRPYNELDISPIVARVRESCSMPSRHVGSAFAIGSVLTALAHPVLGAIVLALGVVIAASRVLGGVHYLTDVTAGAVIGLLSGVAAYLLK